MKPSPDGGLTDGTQVELRFKDKAMFEFVSLLEKARERAIYMKRQLTEDEEGLRKPGVVVHETFINANSFSQRLIPCLLNQAQSLWLGACQLRTLRAMIKRLHWTLCILWTLLGCTLTDDLLEELTSKSSSLCYLFRVYL